MTVYDRWHASRPGTRAEKCEHSKYPSSRHGVGKRWQVRYRDDENVQQSESFHKKGDAENRDIQVAAEAQQGVFRDPSAGKMTLRAYADDWLANRNVSRASCDLMRRRIEKHVYPKLGDMQLRKIKPSMISAWLQGLPGSQNTKRDMFGYVKAILGAAVDDDILARNPAAVRSVKPPKVSPTEARAWTREQVLGVRDALSDRYAILVDIMAGLGLRQGEALGLGKEDVDFLRGIVHVRRQIATVGGKPVFALPKGGKTRNVPLRPTVRDRLAEYLARFPARSIMLPWRDPDNGLTETVELIVTSPQGRHVYANSLHSGPWFLAIDAVGMDHDRSNGCHALRHTYASVLLANGVQTTEVQQYLGHSSPIVTWRVYAHFVPPVEWGSSGERVVRGLAAIDDLLACEDSSCAPDVHRGASGDA